MIDSTLKNSNILIVDDQEANIDVLEGLLLMQGYVNITSVTDPRKVVSLFTSTQPDLILLDLSMPHLTGFEVMEQLKALISANTYLPILILTADVTPEAKQSALAFGASDFLTKPFDLIEVGLRIKNLLFTSYLQQQLHNQNQNLEKKVEERTREIHKKNIELNIAKEKAEANDKLKTSFINNISHEIRTPLNGLLGLGQLLSETTIIPEKRKLYLKMMNESSDRLINTVTNFLDVSLLSSGNQEVNKKDFELNSLLEFVNEKFNLLCQSKNLALIIQPPPSDTGFKLFTDNELLSKILFQLIDNAVKFTIKGSITVGFSINGKQLEIFIKDTGIGISDENQVQIFDYFMQEDISNTRGYEGSGLGLPIAKGMLELLGGKIWLDSEKGKGTTFYFSLPDGAQTTTGTIKKTNQHPVLTDFKHTILVAEDDDINFFYINLLLTHDSIEIIHAKDGVEAVEICRTHPEISLVLMDLKMPNMNGFEATRQIKTFRQTLPVFAVTAYSGGEDKQRAIQAGCSDFLVKPIKKEILADKLATYNITIS